MNRYLNVTMKIDISLCEMTLGFMCVCVCVYIYVKKKQKNSNFLIYVIHTYTHKGIYV